MPEEATPRPLELSVSAIDADLSRCRVELRIDGKYLESGALHLNIGELRSLETDPKGYGVALGRMVFDDPIFRSAYREAIGSVQATGATPRIQLRVASGGLENIRWERIFHPQGRAWFPLATSARTPLSRFIPNRSGKNLEPVYQRPVRILAVIASPADPDGDYGLDPIEDADRRIVHESLSGRDLDVRYLEAGTPRRPTLDALRKHLLEGFHIVHFLCHGSATDRGTVLYLEDAQGGVAWVTSQELIEAFQACDDPPRLCFLAACETSKRHEAGVFLPLGPGLAQIGVAAVVAMADRVGMNAARRFTQMFYSRFLAHGFADRAANEAREAIADTWDWAVPVVFLSEPNGTLIDIGVRDAPQQALLEGLRRNFVGRRDELRQIEAIAGSGDGLRHIVIEAPAGYGKSALMSRLVERHPEWLYHFVRAEERHHTAAAMLESLCTQLSRRVGTPRMFGGLVQSVLETEYQRLRHAAAARLPPAQRLVFVIDGLDESAAGADESIIRPDFYRAESGSICYVLAARSGTVNVERDLGLTRHAALALEGLGTADVRELFTLLNRPDLAEDVSLAEDVVLQTGGEPFYLRFLAEDLAAAEGPVQIPKDLPPDSRNYISRQVRGLDGTKLLELVPDVLRGDTLRAAQAASAILRVLAVSQDWMARTELTAVLSDSAGVDPILANALLPSLRRYFVTHREAGASERDERYMIMPLRLREGIRGAFDQHQLRESERWLLAYCRRWADNSSSYAFHWLTHHLDSLAEYEELLRVVDWPFLNAKAIWLGGLHHTLADISRALHASIQRSDSGNVIRMLLLMARVKRSLEVRAAVGGIALDAAKGLLDSALSSARAIGNPETRFRQLLLIAEAALQQGNRKAANEALDEALTLDIRGSRFPKEHADDLLQLLVLRHRDLQRGLKLARMIEVDTDTFLSKACLLAMEEDQEYALVLVERLNGYYAVETRTKGAAAFAERDPVFSSRLILPALERALTERNCETVLALLPVVRTLDGSAAAEALEAVLRHAQETLQLDPNDRESGKLMNRATVELATSDLQRAWQLALTVCPEVIDTRETRAITIAGILLRAIEHGQTLDLSRVLQALPAPLGERGRVFVDVDHYWGLVAVQLAMTKRWDEAHEYLELAKDPIVRATALIWLTALDAKRDVFEVAGALSACKPTDTWFDETERAMLHWYTSDELRARKALARVSSADVKFALWNAVWKTNRSSDEFTRELIDAATQLDERTTRAAGFMTIAEALATQDTARAVELLEQALAVATSIVEGYDRRNVLERIASLAMKLREQDFAIAAVAAHAASIARDGVDRWKRDTLTDLAVFVLRHRIPIDRTLLDQLVRTVSDSYTRSRVAAGCGGEAYVNELSLQRALDTTGLYTVLLAEAERGKSIAGVRRLGARLTEPASHAFALAAEAGLEPDHTRKLELLRTAWGLVTPADADRDDEVANQRYLLALQLSEVEVEEALARTDALTLWWQHILCGSVAARLGDPQRANEILDRGKRAADAMTAPEHRFLAFASLARNAVRGRPEFATDCQQAALRAIEEMEPEDRVTCHLRVLAWGDKWPRPYVDSLWERLRADLDEVPWTMPDKEKVIKAAGTIEKRELARGAWMMIVAALAAPKVNSYWRHDDAIGQVALALARMEYEEDARRLLQIVAASAQAKNYFDYKAEAFTAAAEKALRDPAAGTRLVTLFQKMQEDAAPPNSGIMTLVALKILAKEYDGIITDESSRHALIEAAMALQDLNYRSDALRALAESASRARKFEEAANLLARVPLSALQAEAADKLMSEFVDTDKAADDSAFWRSIATTAERTAEGLLACASAWVVLHLRNRTTPEDVSAGVAGVLTELDYVQR